PAELQHCDDGVPYCEAGRIRTERHDLSGDVVPWDHGERDSEREPHGVTSPELEITRVQPGRPDADERLAGPRDRHFAIGHELQNLGRPTSVKEDGLHRSSLGRDPRLERYGRVVFSHCPARHAPAVGSQDLTALRYAFAPSSWVRTRASSHRRTCFP